MKKYISILLLIVVLCSTGCSFTIPRTKIICDTNSDNTVFLDTLVKKSSNMQNLTNVYLDDTTIVFVMDLSDFEPDSFTTVECESTHRASTLINMVIDLPEEYFDDWDHIYIDFGEFGSITKTKADIIYSDLDTYIDVKESDLITL